MLMQVVWRDGLPGHGCVCVCVCPLWFVQMLEVYPYMAKVLKASRQHPFPPNRVPPPSPDAPLGDHSFAAKFGAYVNIMSTRPSLTLCLICTALVLSWHASGVWSCPHELRLCLHILLPDNIRFYTAQSRLRYTCCTTCHITHRATWHATGRYVAVCRITCIIDLQSQCRSDRCVDRSDRGQH